MIRLRRIGKKHHPTFRFIVSEKQKDTKGDFLEDLGFYDPHPSPSIIEPKEDRIKHWLAQGAEPSDTVHNLLINKGIIQGEKRKVWTAKKKKAEDGEEEVKPEVKPETKEEPKATSTTEPEAKKEDKVEDKKEETKPEEKPAEPAKPKEENKSEDPVKKLEEKAGEKK